MYRMRYTPSDEEVPCLQWSVDDDTTHDWVDELLDWLDEDKQEPPSLMRQCHQATVVSRS